MFEKLKESAKIKIKEITGNLMGTDTLLLDRKDSYSKGYWEGFIEGLNSAERQLKDRG